MVLTPDPQQPNTLKYLHAVPGVPSDQHRKAFEWLWVIAEQKFIGMKTVFFLEKVSNPWEGVSIPSNTFFAKWVKMLTPPLPWWVDGLDTF